MHLSFQINSQAIEDFLKHWSTKYRYADEEKYDMHIGRPLTEESLFALFEWKNGSVISTRKLESIRKNYPLSFNGHQELRYLNHKESGGAIWNIFYLHCLEPEKWPIFDQHTYRAMIFMTDGLIKEIGDTKKQKYESYLKEYIPFLKSLNVSDHRRVDKALFAFGQFLKMAAKYA